MKPLRRVMMLGIIVAVSIGMITLPTSSASANVSVAEAQMQLSMSVPTSTSFTLFSPGLALLANSAQAKNYDGKTFVDCGTFTCTIWFNRERTKWIDYQLNINYADSKHAGVTALAGALCSPLGWGAAVCAGAAMVVYWHLRDTAKKAEKEKSCIYVKYTRGHFDVVGWGTWTKHNGTVCK